MSEAATVQQKDYNPWRIVLGASLTMCITAGFGFYNHSVLLSALSQSGRYSVNEGSLAISLYFLAAGFSGVFIARLLERDDVRVIMTVFGLSSALALAAVGQVKSLPGLYIAYIIFGIGHGGSALLPATTLITRWFPERRSVALSITSTGLSMGGIIITPWSARLIGDIGLSQATWQLAIYFALSFTLATWVFLRSAPSTTANGAKPIPENGLSHQQARGNRFFWMLTATYTFAMATQVGGIAHLVSLVAQSLGLAGATAIMAVMAMFSIIGRLIGGWLLLNVSYRLFTLSCLSLQIVAMLALSTAESTWDYRIAAAMFGLTVGNLLMLQPLLIAEAFGSKAYSRNFAFSNMVSTIGVASGPILLGLVFSTTGSYPYAYLMAAAAAAIATVLFACAGKVLQFQ